MNFIVAVQVLTDAGVEFAVIGGWSAIMHGSAHLTNDLDLCYSRRPDNLRRLAHALAPYHPRPASFPPELPFIWDDRTLHGGSIFTLDTDLGRIDLLADAAGRPKDLLVLPELESLLDAAADSEPAPES